MSAKKSAEPRRGPGRPPLKPPAPSLEKKGIVDSPHCPENRLEFVLGSPGVLKTFFTYLKNIKSREIHIRCTPVGLTFFTRDHTKSSRVIAHIAGEHIHWYYCDGTFDLGLGRPSVEKMFASIDKTFFKLTISQTFDDPTNLTFILKDIDTDKDCEYKISLPTYAPDLELFEAASILNPDLMREQFPIEFTLTAKQFKKSIGDASNYTDTITYEITDGEPFQLTYAKAGIIYHEYYRSPEKIQLRADIEAGETFRCRVGVANVKSLAASMVTDAVRILCAESGDILFRSAVDAKALVINTLTKLE